MVAISESSLTLHARYRGKIQCAPKVPVRGLEDYNTWYTPGVAEASLAIAADPERVWELTNRGNTVAIVSDGTRVLGLGDVGPLAGLPVMEGKALIFKLLGGVDAVPLMLTAKEPDAFCATVEAVSPSFGGINLEDIAQPKCFGVLARLRTALDIPVWHDDQQGTATVVLAAVLNALAVAEKTLPNVRIALVGMGAANVANYRLLKAVGAEPGAIVACDAGGILHRRRHDLEALAESAPQWSICLESNGEGRVGGIAEALEGADVVLAFSRPGPDTLRPDWVARMAQNAIVIAGANPVPEIAPEAARAAGALIVGTGRSDFPNQVNNALAFPGMFRGVLDVQARTITDSMAIAAAKALALCALDRGLGADHILPTLGEPDVAVRVAVATGLSAQAEGVARRPGSAEELETRARASIDAAQRLVLRG